MNNSQTLTLSDIIVRNNLKPGDLGYIAHMHGDLYAKECGYGLKFESYVLDGLSEFAEKYDPLRDKVWICEHNKLIVGCLIAQHRTGSVQLRYFILLPDFRGIGLGKKLMNEFIIFMKSSSTDHAYLWTTDDQDSAVALYEKYGFILTEEKQSNTFDKPLNEKKYELNLSHADNE